MEQARYWMWAKRKPDLNPHITPSSAAAMSSSYGDSWEEQAFAEDAAGTLGGCVWPPRSYSCSFCRREFRSAQALGGHMNVHRRDRARLKQSPIPAPTCTDHVAVPQNHALSSCTYDPPVLYPSRTSTFLYNNNPNPEFSSPFSHVIRVSSPPSAKVTIGDDQDTNISTLSFFSSLVQKNGKGNIVISSNDPPSWSSFVAGKKRDRDLDLINKEEEEKKSAVVVEPEDKSRADEKEDCVTEDLATNLNLVVCRRQTSYDDEEVAISCKRRRIETKLPLSFVPKLSAVERSCLIPQAAEVLKLRNSANSTAEEVLDLELRLGDAPKVK